MLRELMILDSDEDALAGSPQTTRASVGCAGRGFCSFSCAGG